MTLTDAPTRDDILRAAIAAFPTQKALAHALGQKDKTAESTISRWLSGISTPQEGSVLRLARITKVRPDVALRAFGYDPDELGITYRRSRPGSPPPDFRFGRIAEMLRQFAVEVEAMANASQMPNGSVPHAIASDNQMEYVYQTGQIRAQSYPILRLVRFAQPDIPDVGDSHGVAVA